MKARYYDPVIGRFYSNDPVGFNTANPMMFNRYAYANNSPYRYVDRDGKEGTARSDQIEELGWDDPSAPLANAMSATGDGMVGIGDAIEPSYWDLVGLGLLSRAHKVKRFFGSKDVPRIGIDVDVFMAENSARFNAKLGEKLGRGQLPFEPSAEGKNKAVQTIAKTLETQSAVTKPFENRSGDLVFDVFSKTTGFTVRIDDNAGTFVTLIPEKTKRF